ncbi:MAG: hypothetical protein M1833_007329 [Piccolia ochrophora]|nr:MAG: hypothetical protein M1833_007329 [Piccolia ochrophora]
MKILIRLMIGFLSAFYLANMVCKIFLCTPRSKIWNRTQEGHCLDQNAIFWVTSIVNVVTDFYILVLPLPLIWNLQLRAQKKIGLTLVFMLGLFACITSILRLAKTIEVDDNPDVTFAFNALTLWTVAEIDVGLICACLPALPPFLYHFFPKLSTTIASKIVGSSNPVDTSRSDGPPPMSKTGTVLPASYVDCGDPRLATGKFVEVGDGGAVRDVEGSGGQIGSNTVVVGGARDDWEKDLQDPRMEGIMKTVDLEQS